MGNPINKRTNSILTSGMVKWDGPDIPCLSLCYGDTINEVFYKIATKVCSLVDQYEDLATLDYSCVINLCEISNCADLSDPQKVSLKAIMQVLLNNDCKLKELIDALSVEVNNINNNGLNLDLNLSCLEPVLISICKSTTNYTLNDLLQAMINVICANDSKLTSLINSANTLSNEVNNLTEAVTNSTYEEPNLSAPCINGGVPLIHHEFTQEVAQAICDLQSLVGTSGEVLTALSGNLTSNTNNDLAQNEYNQWIYIQSLVDRILELENNCCKHDCEQISVDYTIEFNGMANDYLVTFSYGTGTNIPPYFEDCGSTFTISDESGNTITIPITITNSYQFTVPGITLNFATTRTVTVSTCFTDGSLNCSEVITKTILPSD